MKTYLYTCDKVCENPVSKIILWREYGKWWAGFIYGKPYLIKANDYKTIKASGFFWFTLQTKGGRNKKFKRQAKPSYKTVIIDKEKAKEFLIFIKTI